MGDAVSAAAVVRLHRTGETGAGVVGGGFVVGPDVIATCAHVVADAIGADPYGPAPTGPVTLDFPHGSTTGELRQAVVHRWSPIAEDGTGDVALLRLTAAAPPDVHRPPLRRVEDLWDHEFRVLGFPSGRADGVWSRGRFRGGQSTRWFQLQARRRRRRSRAGSAAARCGTPAAPRWWA
ncbi:hypothetical protein BJF90_27040 [Pseudonocardia sp. CNS-004]|nr:hypothetical protein BJF90_27040 [Pseudonocardia sp. CNS-004]